MPSKSVPLPLADMPLAAGRAAAGAAAGAPPKAPPSRLGFGFGFELGLGSGFGFGFGFGLGFGLGLGFGAGRAHRLSCDPRSEVGVDRGAVAQARVRTAHLGDIGEM